MAKSKKINLALQGGGAHGAFTWGLLDKFLESGLFTIEGISATSSGSMNAAVLAYGLIQDGKEGAREALYNFWHAISEYHSLLGLLATSPFNLSLFSAMPAWYSPYDLNPGNFHPIREILSKLINFEELKNNSPIKLFICATNVRTGKIRIFNNQEISMDALLASACLPKIYQAVEIDGDYYWDGGYLGNPAIFPLIYNTLCKDILIFHTVPIVRQAIPKTSTEIDTRLRELSFNSSLMREMRAIAFMSNLISEGWIKEEFAHKLKKVFVHCIRADESLNEFPLVSVYTPSWDFLVALRDLGRQQATLWLEKNHAAIGKKTTIDFDEWL